MRARFTLGTIAVTIACASTVAACGSSDDGGGSSSGAASGGDTLTAKVAVINDVTGALAFVGSEQKNAAQLAIDDVNSSDMGVKLEADFMDSQSKPASGVSDAQKALADSDVDAIIGYNITEAGNSVQPIVAADGRPTIFLQVTQLPERSPNVFSMGPPTGHVAQLAAQQVAGEKPASAAILWVQQPTLADAAKTFKSTLESAGVKVPVYEGASLESTSFDSQVAKAVAAKPDAVGVSGTGPQAGAMLAALRSRGFKGTIFAQQAADAPSARKAAGDAYNGVIIGTYWNAAAANADSKKFVDLYAQKFPKDPPPDVYGLQAWDAVHVYAQAIKQAGTTDKDKVVKTLSSGTFTGGLQDSIAFGSDGFAKLDGYVVQMDAQGAKVLERPQG
jgi:branched-chain amino acid transport system substrate-binding protein